LAALKVYAQREDMKLTDVTVRLTGTNYNDENDVTSAVIYADDGITPLTNPVNYVAEASQTQAQDDQDGAVDVDLFAFTSSDFINDIVFTKNQYKTLLVKFNVSSAASETDDGGAISAVTLNVPKAAGFLSFIGQDSGTAYDASNVAAVTFAIGSPYNGGTFSFDDKVIALQKASTSPSGSTARGTQTVVGVWDVNNYDSTNAAAVLTGITLTSKTGLPSGLVNADDDTSFSLYDGDGNLLAGGAADDDNVTLTQATGKIAFANVDLTVNPGEPKQIRLVIDTTNTAKWPSNTQLQWSLETAAEGVVTNGEVGYAAGIWTIPAVANVVTLP